MTKETMNTISTSQVQTTKWFKNQWCRIKVRLLIIIRMKASKTSMSRRILSRWTRGCLKM